MNMRVGQRRDHIDRSRHHDDRWLAPLMHSEIATATQACCCPARAAYAVVIAPTASLPSPPEILLCGHHARVSRERLSTPDVAVYDASGHLVVVDGRFSVT